MKIKSSILCLAATVILVSSCGDTVKAEIKLNTIQCGMCVNKIKSSLNELDGVVSVDVSLDKKVGVVTYNAGLVELTAIENAIATVGYDANDTKANTEAYNKLDACCKIPGK
jgi:copper chaperone CopZ|tara:strand:+ start:846 stop:1181 length:336 start_codon:yes stop_codon:yes gene_type:complete